MNKKAKLVLYIIYGMYALIIVVLGLYFYNLKYSFNLVENDISILLGDKYSLQISASSGNFNVNDYTFKLSNDNLTLDGITLSANKEGNTCEEEKKDCSDITKDKYEQECSEISASSSEKKCSFSNSVCSEVSKSCLELSLLYSATNDICSSAPTSNPSNKVCVKKEEGIGCEEKDKSSDSSNQSGSSSNPSSSSGTGQNNNQNNQNNQNNKGTFVLGFKFSLLFIIFGLFL